VRRKDDEFESFGCEQLQRFHVDRGLRQPHALGPALEPMLEVGDAPADLRDAVTPVRERHDDVVVDLRHGRSVTAEALLAVRIGVENHAINAPRVDLKPGKKRWAEVEAHAAVVVDDADDAVVRIHDAGGAVGRVAFGGYALVPVVIRIGGILKFNRL
jgi:hypothetical protein